jgi:hypothetical protein
MSARAAKVESKASKFRVTAEGICAPSHSQTTYQTRFPRTVGSHIAWGIFTLYAVVIVVSLFFIRTMDDAVRLLS